MTSSRTRFVRLLACLAGASLSLGAAVALGQQPPPPAPPGQPQLRQIPPVQGQQRGPITIGPDGKPRIAPNPLQPLPGNRPTRPGLPPPPSRGHAPGSPSNRAHAAEPAGEHDEHGGGEHACPGHGPDDPPGPINTWHGLLWVDNERALQPGFLNQLLFRYNNPKDPCDPRNQPAPYLASLINFGILLLLLFRFGQKPLERALVGRKQAITAEIDNATRLKEDAEDRLADLNDEIASIDAKLEEVRAEYQAQGEVERRTILADAEERRARMRREAELRVEQERKAARDELLREAVVAATKAAEELIQKQLSGGDHDRMAQAYLAAIGQAVSSASSVSNVRAAG